jgi:crossover junction endodeoxyribonuclease RuvC
MIVVGIDPGQSGAIAYLLNGDFLAVEDMPLMPRAPKGKQIHGAALAKQLRNAINGLEVTVAIEKVGAMPGQGVTSMFRFGESCGVIRGVVEALELPYRMVAPQTWKRRQGLIGQEKDYARTVASGHFPWAELSLKKHIGRADALLIARDSFLHSVLAGG